MARDDTDILRTIIASSTNKSAVAAAQTELGALQQRKAAIAAAIRPVLDVPQIVAQPTVNQTQQKAGVLQTDENVVKNIRKIREDIKKIFDESKKSRTTLESILKSNQEYYEANSELFDRLTRANELNADKMDALAELTNELKKRGGGIGGEGSNGNNNGGGNKDRLWSMTDVFAGMGAIGAGVNLLIKLVKGVGYLVGLGAKGLWKTLKWSGNKLFGNSETPATEKPVVEKSPAAIEEEARRTKLAEQETERARRAAETKARLKEETAKKQAAIRNQRLAAEESTKASIEEAKLKESVKVEDPIKATKPVETGIKTEFKDPGVGKAPKAPSTAEIKTNTKVPNIKPKNVDIAGNSMSWLSRKSLGQFATDMGFKGLGYFLSPELQATADIAGLAAGRSGMIGIGGKAVGGALSNPWVMAALTLLSMNAPAWGGELEASLDSYMNRPGSRSRQETLKGNIVNISREMDPESYAKLLEAISHIVQDYNTQSFIKSEVEKVNQKATTKSWWTGEDKKVFDPVTLPLDFGIVKDLGKDLPGANDKSAIEQVGGAKPVVDLQNAMKKNTGSTTVPTPKIDSQKLNNVSQPSVPPTVNIINGGDTINNVTNQSKNSGGGSAGAVSGTPSKIPNPWDVNLYGGQMIWGN